MAKLSKSRRIIAFIGSYIAAFILIMYGSLILFKIGIFADKFVVWFLEPKAIGGAAIISGIGRLAIWFILTCVIYKWYIDRKEKEDSEPEPRTVAEKWRRELRALEKSLGPDHLDVARAMNKFAVFLHNQGQESYAEAVCLHKHALSIFEKSLSPDDPDLAISLTNLAWTYYSQGEYEQAEPLYKRAILIYDKQSPNNPSLEWYLEPLAKIFRRTNREADAIKLEQRVASIRAIKR